MGTPVPASDLPSNLVPANDLPDHLVAAKPKGGGGAFDAQGNPSPNVITSPQEQNEQRERADLPWDVILTGDQMMKSREMVKRADEALPLATKEPGAQHLLSGILSAPIIMGEEARGIRPQPQGVAALGEAAMALGAPPVGRLAERGAEAALKPPTADMGPPPTPTMSREAAGKIATSVSENASAKFGANARPEIVDAHKAGYVFPPAEIPPLGGKVGLVDSAFAGEGGKIKLQQLASTKNQANTDRLATQGIGLPPGTHLNDQAFAKAKEAPAAIYNEVKNAIPEVSLGSDPIYAHQAANVGGRNSLVEKYFPELKENPGILALRQTLLRNQSVPTDVAMKAIADLRSQATQNFKAIGDSAAQKHALALAQKEAANIMEQAIERATQDVPGYYRSKLKEATKFRDDVMKERVAQGLPLSGEVVDAAQGAVDGLSQKLQMANSKNQTNQTLTERFRDARKAFAKIYTLEDATNTTTGHVSARGLARLSDKGAALSDELKSIAEAYNAAPKSMQIPEQFGRSEDWSALDFFGTATALMHGNVPIAAGIGLRPIVRKHLLSPSYQNRLIGNQPVPALPEVANTARALGGP